MWNFTNHMNSRLAHIGMLCIYYVLYSSNKVSQRKYMLLRKPQGKVNTFTALYVSIEKDLCVSRVVQFMLMLSQGLLYKLVE